MYYIKCNQCGHLNDFQNDYLTFCSSCNKKLENNYTSWQKSNPSKSKEEYIQLFCISDEEFQERALNKPKKKSKLAYLIGLAIVVSISSALASIGVNELIDYYKKNKNIEKVSEGDWELKSYGTLGLSAETPFDFEQMELPLPEELKSIIDLSESYTYNSKGGLYILINSVMYSDQIGEFSLDGAAQGSINEMKIEEGVRDLNFEQDDFELNNIPGFRQTGTFLKEETLASFINMGFSKGKIFYQMLLIYPQSNKNAKSIAERISSSVYINN